LFFDCYLMVNRDILDICVFVRPLWSTSTNENYLLRHITLYLIILVRK